MNNSMRMILDRRAGVIYISIDNWIAHLTSELLSAPSEEVATYIKSTLEQLIALKERNL